MKNIFKYLLIPIMALTLFISCSNEMQGEPLAYVSFGDNSRAIESTNESLPVVNDLLWKYTAVKKDEGLKTGKTSDTPINIKDGNTPGLSNTQVGPFSIGSWEFTLFGYTKESDSSDTYDKLVYQGSKIVSLSANTTTTVSVDIQYAGDETQGTLKLYNLILKDSNGNDVSGGANEAKLVLNGIRKDGNSTSNVSFEYEIGENRKFSSDGDTIDAGIWQFTFRFEDAYGNIVSNIQSKYILIMGGKTTTLSGNVREYEQNAQFVANHYYQQYNDSFWVIGNTEVALNATKDAAQKYSEDNSVPAYVYLNGDITTSNPIEFNDSSSVSSRTLSASVVKPSKVILNLNGKQISYQNNTNPEAAIIINNPGLTLVISDNSEIQTAGIISNNDCFDVIKGSLIIEGGEVSGSTAVKVSAGATAEISGGKLTGSMTALEIKSKTSAEETAASVVISGNAQITVNEIEGNIAIKNGGDLFMEGGKISGSTAIQITNKNASTILESGKIVSNNIVSKDSTISEKVNAIISDKVEKSGELDNDNIEVKQSVGDGTENNPYCVGISGSFINVLSLINDNKSNNHIKLIKDIVLEDTIKINTGIILDLNGYSIHGNNVRALQFLKETSIIKGAGEITSDVPNVKSSVIRVGNDLENCEVSLTIESEVSISTDSAYGITVFGSGAEVLTVKGRIYSNAPNNQYYDGCAISTNGDDLTPATIHIEEGSSVISKNANAIYMPSGNLIVNGGAVTGLTGIYVKSGNTTINGGTIIGNGSSREYTYNGDGGVSTGDALVVDNCGYPNGKPIISVKGGYFDSANSKTVGNYSKEGMTPIEGFISGGHFTDNPSSIKNGAMALYENNEYVVYQTWILDAQIYDTATDLQINSIDDFAAFAATVNNGINYSGKTVTLNSNIDLAEKYWMPINGFNGTFDGNNYTISNLRVYDTTPEGQGFGLFGVSNGSIKNLTINNATVYGNAAIGAFVGKGNGLIDNCRLTGLVYIGTTTDKGYMPNFNSSYIGGIRGNSFQGTITNCTVDTENNSIITGGRQVGGILGFDSYGNPNSIKNCTVNNITIYGNKSIGGIVGWSNSTGISNSRVSNTTIQFSDDANELDSIGFISGSSRTLIKDTETIIYENNTVDENSRLIINNNPIKYDGSSVLQLYSPYSARTYIKIAEGKYMFTCYGISKSLTKGDYVTALDSSYQEFITINEGENKTIDLNGAILYGSVEEVAITNNGTLKICNGRLDGVKGEGTTTKENITDYVVPVIAQINRNDQLYKFGSISAAVDSAEVNDTITIMQDTAETFKVTKNLTIDLNGKTITGTNYYTVDNYASLTIKDSIGNGKILGTNYTIYNNTRDCSFTLSSGSVESTLSTINHYGVAIYSKSLSSVIINGGFVKAVNDGLWYHTPIYGCQVIITGGTFSHDPSQYVDPNNYNVIQNESSLWEVSKKTSV